MVRIDAHAHLFAPGQRERRAALVESDAAFAEMYGNPGASMAAAAELERAMAAAGLDGAVIAGFAFGAQIEIDEQNAYLLAAARDNSSFIPLATINPSLPGWPAAASAALEGGARGFGELRPHNQGWDPLGPEARQLYGTTQDADGVLLWHVSEPIGHSYAGKRGGISAAELWQVAAGFPGLRMIAAHLGGGLSFFLQMPEVRDVLHNIWFDTAAYGLLYDDSSVARLVDLAGPGRVLFGSDYPLLSPRRQLQRLSALLPGDVAQAVCGGNAEFLFSDKHDS